MGDEKKKDMRNFMPCCIENVSNVMRSKVLFYVMKNMRAIQ